MSRLILIFFLVNLLTFSIIFEDLFSKDKVVFLDVGQGSSILIKHRRKIFLYDVGGNKTKILKGLREEIPFFKRKIEVVFLSHADKDHYGVFEELSSRYKIKVLVVPDHFFQDAEWVITLQKIQNKIHIVKLRRGDIILDGNLKFLVLNPWPSLKNSGDNNNSLVLKIEKIKSFLLTGDIEKEAIEDILKCCRQILLSDFLAIPHHGSKYSLSLDFLKTVNPKLAIIQVGKNNYRHPHSEVLEALEKLKIDYARTDLGGSIKINF